MQIKYISAVVMVKDIPTARAFYEGLLGQKVVMDHGPNVAFEGGFAIWEKEHASQVIFHRPASDGGKTDDHAMEIYFESADLDAVREKLLAHQVKFVHDLVEQPWAQRVLRVYDPDGTIVEVGEPMDVVIVRFLKSGLSIEDVVQRTFMPREIIEQIAATVPQA